MSEETLTTESEVVPRKRKKKSKNPFVRYFVPFGLKQAVDLLMIAAAIVVLIGLIVHGVTLNSGALIAGFIMYAVGSIISIFRCIRVLMAKDKTKSEKKTAKINAIIMSVILAIAVLGVVAAFMWW